jgi:hypothetical protein
MNENLHDQLARLVSGSWYTYSIPLCVKALDPKVR